MQVKLIFEKHEELPKDAVDILNKLENPDAQMDEQLVVLNELRAMGYEVETDMDGEISEISKMFEEVRPNAKT